MTQSTVRVGVRGDTECGVMKLKKENTFFPPTEWFLLCNFAKTKKEKD